MPQRPRLTTDILADDVRLGETIGQILFCDAALRRIQRHVVRLQGALRGSVTDEQWHRYMLVEDAFNGYHATAVTVVARAFYAAGRRAKGRRS